MGALLCISLVTASAGESEAKAAITRGETCSRLSHQVDEAIETHAKARQVAEAKVLQKKANRFCAAKKEAQGIRMLADALKLLGVAPVDPNQ
jgi:hypothetical protein